MEERTTKFHRRYPVGAEILPDRSGVHFRVWAPERRCVQLVFESQKNAGSAPPHLPDATYLNKDDEGYFSAFLPYLPENVLYGYNLDQTGEVLPDPASHFQPYGPDGLSQIIDHTAYHWNDSGWSGCNKDDIVLYEMHAGTFTAAGTWMAALDHIPELARLGITVIELLPIAEFRGEFNWGYDGIFQFAPFHGYGTSDQLRSFIDGAHQYGIAVILDVVYNHIGRGVEIFQKFSPYYFTSKYKNEWGAAISFDEENSIPVREYFLSNAAYWVQEFHIDGFRIDATQQIFDISEPNIIAEIVSTVHRLAAGRTPFIIAENECQDTSLYYYGIDAVWSDDFHRSATVALTGRREAYYSDYRGVAREFVSAAKYGYLYQGQYYTWQKKTRGTPALNLSPHYFIHYLQNHDQIANSIRGLRIHQLCEPALLRAFTVLLLLGPQIPLLFQGQEFCSSSPFYFFTNKTGVLAERAKQGRRIFLSQFPSILSSDGPLVPPIDKIETFKKCKLDFKERQINSAIYSLHKDLLSIRKTSQVYKESKRKAIDGALLHENAFAIRFMGVDVSYDRLLIVNLGSDVALDPNPEPLTAPPQGYKWQEIINSENPKYGGCGTVPLNIDTIPILSGHTAYFLGTIREEPQIQENN